MKSQVLALYDDDTVYAKRLAGALSIRRDLPFSVRLFTGEKELTMYLAVEEPEILLVNENSYERGLGSSFSGKLILLREELGEAFGSENKQLGVYKYQSCDSLCRQMVGYSGHTLLSEREEMHIYGFYSFLAPEARSCLAALFAWQLGREISDPARTLFVNLDEFSSLLKFLPPVSGRTISDALLAFEKDDVSFGGELLTMTGKNAWFSYLAPFTCADDCETLQADSLKRFLLSAAIHLDCENVVLDMGQALPKAWEMFSICDTVFVPENHDVMGRMESFGNFMSSTGRGDILERVVRFEIKECRLKSGDLDQSPNEELRSFLAQSIDSVYRPKVYKRACS